MLSRSLFCITNCININKMALLRTIISNWHIYTVKTIFRFFLCCVLLKCVLVTCRGIDVIVDWWKLSRMLWISCWRHTTLSGCRLRMLPSVLTRWRHVASLVSAALHSLMSRSHTRVVSQMTSPVQTWRLIRLMTMMSSLMTGSDCL